MFSCFSGGGVLIYLLYVAAGPCMAFSVSRHLTCVQIFEDFLPAYKLSTEETYLHAACSAWDRFVECATEEMKSILNPILKVKLEDSFEDIFTTYDPICHNFEVYRELRRCVVLNRLEQRYSMCEKIDPLEEYIDCGDLNKEISCRNKIFKFCSSEAANLGRHIVYSAMRKALTNCRCNVHKDCIDCDGIKSNCSPHVENTPLNKIRIVDGDLLKGRNNQDELPLYEPTYADDSAINEHTNKGDLLPSTQENNGDLISDDLLLNNETGDNYSVLNNQPSNGDLILNGHINHNDLVTVSDQVDDDSTWNEPTNNDDLVINDQHNDNDEKFVLDTVDAVKNNKIFPASGETENRDAKEISYSEYSKKQPDNVAIILMPPKSKAHKNSDLGVKIKLLKEGEYDTSENGYSVITPNNDNVSSETENVVKNHTVKVNLALESSTGTQHNQMDTSSKKSRFEPVHFGEVKNNVSNGSYESVLTDSHTKSDKTENLTEFLNDGKILDKEIDIQDNSDESDGVMPGTEEQLVHADPFNKNNEVIEENSVNEDQAISPIYSNFENSRTENGLEIAKSSNKSENFDQVITKLSKDQVENGDPDEQPCCGSNKQNSVHFILFIFGIIGYFL